MDTNTPTRRIKILVGFVAAVLGCVCAFGVPVYAVWNGQPYAPGATLSPECAPTQSQCTVTPPAGSGVNTNITALDGLTTPIKASQGGTGIGGVLPVGTMVFGSGGEALSSLAVGTLGQILTVSGSGTPAWVDPAAGTVYSAGSGLALSGGTVFSLDLAHANNWTALQTFGGGLSLGGNTYTDLAGTGLILSSGTLSSALGTSIDTTEIVDGTITGTDIANSTITAAKLAQSGCVNTDLLQWNSGSGAWSCGTYINNASQIINTPAGTISATTVQGALNELDSKKLATTLASGMLLVGDGTNNAHAVNLSGDATLSNTGALTIGNDAVALGTDTTGNYVVGIVAGTGLAVTGSGSEGASPTVGIDTAANITWTGVPTYQNGIKLANGNTITSLEGLGLSLSAGTLKLDPTTLTAISSLANTDSILVAQGGTAKLITKNDLFASIIGGMNYQGTWDASTNTPNLTSACTAGTKGQYFVVAVAGTTNLNGISNWGVNDWAVCNGTAWQRVQTTNNVNSVFGRTGTVVAANGDYNAGQITNTPAGNIAATTVQGALNELDTEKVATGSDASLKTITITSGQAQTVALMNLTNNAGSASLFNTTGTPEGAVTSGIGSLAIDTAGGSMYIKTTATGNTGWAQFGNSNGCTATGCSFSSTGTNTISVSGVNGALTVNANGSGTVQVGNAGSGDVSVGTNTGNLNLGTGGNAKTITIGNGTSTTTLNLVAGTGGISQSATTTTGTASSLAANAVTTGTGMAIVANGLTSGNGLAVISSSAALTGSMVSVSLAGNNAANTGSLMNLSSTGASNAATGLKIDTSAGTGLAAQLNGAVALASSAATYTSVGTQNNVSFGNTSSVRLNPASALTITGIAAGKDGQLLTLMNVSSVAVVLSNQSASSTVTNRIVTGTGADLTLGADASTLLQYDGTSGRWRVIGGTGATGSSANTIQSISTTGTVSAWGSTVKVDATSAPVTATLPTAVGNAGKLIEVVKTDSSSNNVAIKGNASETINGSTNAVYLYNVGDSVILRSDGTNVYIVADNRSGGAGGTAAANYLYAVQTTIQGAPAASTKLNFESIASQAGTDVTYTLATQTFRLKAGRTYYLTGNGATMTGGSSGRYTIRWFNATAGSSIGTETIVTSPNNTGADSYSGGPATATITPSIDTDVQLRVVTVVGSGNIGGSNLTGAGGAVDVQNSANWAMIQEVSAPQATTSTVDYIEARKVATQSATALPADVVFDAVAAGNIPLNTSTGVFTLTAGKTYELSATLRLLNGGAATDNIDFAIVDAVSNTQLAGSTAGSLLPTTWATNNSSAQPTAHAIYTPTTNQTVKVRLSGTGTGGATIQSGVSYMIIKQIGSTASTGVAMSALTAAIASGSLDNTGYTQTWNWNSLGANNGLVINSSDTTATGNLFSVSNASTGTAVSGLAHFGFTGAHGGAGVQVDDATQTGTALAVNTTAVTTGSAVGISAGSVYTGAGLVAITANVATTGTIEAVTANGLTSGTGLAVNSSSTSLTGNVANFNATGASNTGNALRLSNTGTGLALLLSNGGLAIARGTDYATIGSTNNVAFSNHSNIRLTGASAQTITGIANGVDGKLLVLTNAGATTATLANNSASSTAANRITGGGGRDVSILSGNSVMLVYDAGASLWRVVDGVPLLAHVRANTLSASGGGGPGNALTAATEEYDATNSFTPATGVFTAPRNGYYHVAFQAFVASSTGCNVGGKYGFLFSRNGAAPGAGNPMDSVYCFTANPTNIPHGAAETLFLSAGDTLTVRVVIDTATGVTVSGNANYDFLSIDELP